MAALLFVSSLAFAFDTPKNGEVIVETEKTVVIVLSVGETYRPPKGWHVKQFESYHLSDGIFVVLLEKD